MIQTDPHQFDPDNPLIEPGSVMAHVKVYAQQEQPAEVPEHANTEGKCKYRGDAAPAAFSALSALLMLADDREADGLTVLPGEIRDLILTKIQENPR